MPTLERMQAHPATPTAAAPGRRPGRRGRPALDRDRIITAALELIDETGVEALSMRSLGKHLGFEAMALYRHVEGREDLLEAVVDRLMSGLELPPDPGTWQEYLKVVAHQVRGLAQQHPRAFPLVATRHPAAPWLRPPLRSLDVVEHFLSTLRAQGWSPTGAVEAYQAFSSFLLGYLLLEAANAGAPTGPPDAPLDEGQSRTGTGPAVGHDSDTDLSGYPTVRELRPYLEEDRTDAEFAAGLASVLDRLSNLK